MQYCDEHKKVISDLEWLKDGQERIEKKVDGLSGKIDDVNDKLSKVAICVAKSNSSSSVSLLKRYIVPILLSLSAIGLSVSATYSTWSCGSVKVQTQSK